VNHRSVGSTPAPLHSRIACSSATSAYLVVYLLGNRLPDFVPILVPTSAHLTECAAHVSRPMRNRKSVDRTHRGLVRKHARAGGVLVEARRSACVDSERRKPAQVRYRIKPHRDDLCPDSRPGSASGHGRDRRSGGTSAANVASPAHDSLPSLRRTPSTVPKRVEVTRPWRSRSPRWAGSTPAPLRSGTACTSDTSAH
jgi:hypothetical protein